MNRSSKTLAPLGCSWRSEVGCEACQSLFPPVLPVVLFEAICLSSSLFLFDGVGKEKRVTLGDRHMSQSSVVKRRAESPRLLPLRWLGGCCSAGAKYAPCSVQAWLRGVDSCWTVLFCFFVFLFFFFFLLKKTTHLLAAKCFRRVCGVQLPSGGLLELKPGCAVLRSLSFPSGCVVRSGHLGLVKKRALLG